MTVQRYYSNIYWHFTGSPEGIDWHAVRCPCDIIKQNPLLKADKALANLKMILESRKLLGSCTERVLDDLVTEKFCCVTDIPFKDLPSQVHYYGKVAIGFTASAIHKTFLPVMYVPTDSIPVMEMLVPNRKLTKMAYEFLNYSGSFQEQQALKLMAQAARDKETIRKPDSDAMKGYLMNFVKITDFHTSPENTFYREREWRNIGDFIFSVKDIAAIIAPEVFLDEVRAYLDEKNYPGSISLVAWEFIEYA